MKDLLRSRVIFLSNCLFFNCWVLRVPVYFVFIILLYFFHYHFVAFYPICPCNYPTGVHAHESLQILDEFFIRCFFFWYCPTVCVLSLILLTWLSAGHILLQFSKVQVINCHMDDSFAVVFKKSLSNLRSSRFSSMLCSQSVRVLPFACKSVTYFELLSFY